MTPKEPTDEQIHELARKSGKLSGGELEMEHMADVSRGNSNGAYVQVWMWVSFKGTQFDREKKA